MTETEAARLLHRDYGEEALVFDEIADHVDAIAKPSSVPSQAQTLRTESDDRRSAPVSGRSSAQAEPVSRTQAAEISPLSGGPPPLEVLKLRAWAVAKLIENHFLLDKATAVDALWDSAETTGLVREIGADAVQHILAEAFSSC